MQREQERGFRRDGSDQGVSPCDISRNIMPTPGADAVAELPQLSPECNTSNGVGRIGVALERPSGDLGGGRSEEHTSELQSLLRISYAVFCFTKKKPTRKTH